ncbi:glycosyltransferase [Lactobacillus salivarius]|uniref:Glycosyltransferase n=1 Tax=Ligilactobacillus salivarius TaxID=1624 RepID=A0A6A8LXZ5_9LACO|nr:glycosyltransferase [Ligilactobacillus salivarius]MSE07030.1 glycosyltransferase [Ligilactobacillus salivarius]MSE07646.1 glycosyltransferase [Ligilactobacillus salivarius]
MVKVSIGIPVYNVAEYLRECLDSIMNQTFKDFEVILVDDGSTDASFSICQEYMAKDNRFKLIHQRNKGLAGARNTCLKYMKGAYVTWVDSDDVVDDNYLERLLEVQEKTGADIVKCVKKHLRANNVFYITSYNKLYETEEQMKEVSKVDLLLDALDNRLMVLEFWGTLIPRQLYKGIVLSQGKIYEDQGNRFKLYLRSKKNVLLLEQLYSYRIRQGSIMDARREQTSLSKKLHTLRTYMFNWDKLMYYVDLSNYKVDEMREIYMKRLDELSVAANLNEEDVKFIVK